MATTPTPPESAPVFMFQLPESALGGLTSKQKGFVMSIRSIRLEVTGEALREGSAERFPPAHFFSQEICDMPSVWMELRNFLDARGARLMQHSSRRVLLTLTHRLYTEAEDRTVSIKNSNLIVTAGSRVRQDLAYAGASTIHPPEKAGKPAKETLLEDRVEHNVAMRLEELDKKFSGSLGDCWNAFVDKYNQISRDYKLNEAQKLQ